MPDRGSPLLLTAALAYLLAAVLIAPAVAQTPANPELDRARAERQRLGSDLDHVTTELEQLTVAITDAESQRTRLEAEVTALEDLALNARQILTDRAVKAYMYGDFGPVGELMTAVQPGDLLERSQMLAGLGLRERVMVERAVIARAALASRQTALDRVLSTLRESDARGDTLRAELERAFSNAKADEAQLASQAERQRQLSRPGQRGVYSCPMGVPYHFRDTWGAPRSGGRRHKGVDMFAPYGGNVYAITNGSILRHSRSALGGLALYLKGDDGNVYYYAHLSSILPASRPGKRVVAGELIAKNGDSGNARGGAPHVHMEVRPNGAVNTNPYPFAAASCF
ncbi:MAG: murein hydrolase activator EnvC family protein [Egibacteraceae bacterium]